MENEIIVKTTYADVSVIICCEEFEKEIKEEYLISILTSKGFTRNRIPTTMFLCSDGGHGGTWEMKYCPFCGRKIKIK